ncbi:MAG: chemotaxis protein CheW [Firmicutes bacterium HGW-Firmicutes-12]|jgi:purine-binding chemotaxis protein CheW|nr:MAG: chemotaxis protein CheW [Firmicutes bacterium HGW-Firmicutes-12]
MQLVVFKIGKEEYGFNIQDVQEIVLQQKTTEIPNMPFYMEGIINLRDKVIPVISMAKKFSMEYKQNGDNTTRFIVLNLQNGNQIAIWADEVTEVLTVEDKDIKAPPQVTSDSLEICMTGIAKIKEKLIILLDTKKIMDFDVSENKAC